MNRESFSPTAVCTFVRWHFCRFHERDQADRVRPYRLDTHEVTSVNVILLRFVLKERERYKIVKNGNQEVGRFRLTMSLWLSHFTRVWLMNKQKLGTNLISKKSMSMHQRKQTKQNVLFLLRKIDCIDK